MILPPIWLRHLIKKRLGLASQHNEAITLVNGQKVVFVRIPKTGTTSITTLLGWEPDKHFVHCYDQAGNIIDKPAIHPKTCPHQSLTMVKEYVFPLTFSRAYKVSFVRNPWDRMLSQYNYFVKINHSQLQECPIPFTQWLDYVLGPTKHPDYYHTPLWYQPQFDWLSLDGETLGVDFVGKFETLAEDWAVVARELDLPTELPHLNKSGASSGRKPYQDAYNDYTRQLVAKVYEKDIDTWGYTFD